MKKMMQTTFLAAFVIFATASFSYAQYAVTGNGAFPFHGDVTKPFEFLTDKEQDRMEKERTAEIKRAAANQSNPSPSYKPRMTVVNNVYIPYTSTCAVRYTYDPASGRFMRFVAGKPHHGTG